jgi:excinuclease ABC subunit C
MDISYLQKKKLPEEPGVYFFKKGPNILYIGKATSLRDRVRSYFSNDVIHARGMLIVDMVSQADEIDFEKTDSVLEALILEANLIKKHQPKYNTKEKDDKSFNYVIITDEDFPRVLVIRGRDLEHIQISGEIKIKYTFGPYTQGRSLQEAMKIIRKIFTYRDKCVPFVEHPSTNDLKELSKKAKPCFNRQLGLCPGVCSGEINKQEYARIINHIRLFFEGHKVQLIRELKKEMKQYAKEQEFEKAEQVKRQIFSLGHIRDVSLIREDFNNSLKNIQDGNGSAFRIEAYDIAHTGGKNTTGVMVVVEEGLAKKSDYRMFKIRGIDGKVGNNDVANLKEVLTRRFNHIEWPLPQLVAIDGGEAQLNMARAFFEKMQIETNVVSVVKNEQHRPRAILGDSELAEKHQKEIILANSEAHRFTLKYHRKLRGKSLF